MRKVFVICEKPSAVQKIAEAIAGRRVAQKELMGIPYCEFERDGKLFVVAPAMGHLFTLKSKKSLKDYPVFDLEWVPIYEVEKGARNAARFIKALKELARGADEFISACDFDVEGSVIAFNILRFICGEEAVAKAKRMKFSALTRDELRRSFENMMDRLDFEVINAGLARHYLDWYWGMNLSRFLSSAAERAGGRFIKLSAGRVQTPTLRILLDRDREIKEFKPVPFWVLKAIVEFDGQELVAEHEVERFWEREEAERARAACAGHPAKVAKVARRSASRSPPPPFDLGTLQSEAYRCFGFTPMRTQTIAQDLYQAALISYPRTSSQKLPPSIGYREILGRLARVSPEYARVAEDLLRAGRLSPVEGRKTDPAHPAIYPTGEPLGELPEPHKKLYDMIVRRFLAVFDSPAVVEGMRADLDIGGQRFILRGQRLISPGWLRSYGKYVDLEEQPLPDLEEGEELPVREIVLEERKTQPPPRFNPASLVREMEARGLGTEATRGQIIQTLYDRGYIRGNQISVTQLGQAVVEGLRVCPAILSEDLTARFEEEMRRVQEGKADWEEVVRRAREELSRLIAEMREKEAEVGESLLQAHRRLSVLGKCPKCGKDLRVVVARKSGKRFVGCSSYPSCDFSLPLPQQGMIELVEKPCGRCGWPVILVRRRGRRPYRLCLNPSCPSKAEESYNREE
jgi:DNA topoisomerase-1